MATTPDRATASSCRLKTTLRTLLRKKAHDSLPVASPSLTTPQQPTLPPLSPHRAALPESARGTVLYLAYGSNLCHEAFQGRRGIKPLSALNVQVPSLRLTFDLPGLPYAEPCFANSGRRDPAHPSLVGDDTSSTFSAAAADRAGAGGIGAGTEKTPLLGHSIDIADGGLETDGYNKDTWHKGLIGVVYEVTPADYSHIIATEGGGSSYHDILVPCHPLPYASNPSDPGVPDPSAPVPDTPTTAPFVAHTLFSPRIPPGEQPPKDGGRFQRPDPSYAQPSSRYLKLITSGAAEHSLPYEYREYLASIGAYTITSNRQRVGQFVFLGLWMPFLALVFALQKLFSNEKGESPRWLVLLTGAIFGGVWASYDEFFKGVFGDGERTVQGDEEGCEARGCGECGGRGGRRSGFLGGREGRREREKV